MTGKDVEDVLSGLPVSVYCAEDVLSYVSDRPRTFVVNTDNCIKIDIFEKIIDVVGGGGGSVVFVVVAVVVAGGGGVGAAAGLIFGGIVAQR
ncbi:Hypothetical predicted protein [Mytilus galloprovincialis]|uniref:Uncharacterized protein n=1 Tax=Mytilus galloprovincialis TaxID=29158 RepID=A0A8B6F7M0_MYTGA|nr:Hypothetical predicted protein [Mytilus galloprovincialis]